MAGQDPNQDRENAGPVNQPEDETDSVLVKLSAENLDVSKQKVTTGRVKISRKTVHRQEEINELLTQEHVEIEHVAKEIPVDSIPDIREENGVTIIPVVEEKIEVVRTLILKEELHIKKVKKSTPFHKVVTLRSQELFVDRQEED